jgi:ATP-dependent 26S proteasome regulatory subunit
LAARLAYSCYSYRTSIGILVALLYRYTVVARHTRTVPQVSSYYYLVPLNVSYCIYGRSTGGFTGAELKQVVQEAALAALRADVKASHITAAHFKSALHKVSRVKLSQAGTS